MGNVITGISHQHTGQTAFTNVEVQGNDIYVAGRYDLDSGSFIYRVNQAFLKSSHLNVQLCKGDSVFFGNSWIKQSGLYFDTLTNHFGMDSMVALNLSVLTNETFLDYKTCSPDSIVVDGKKYFRTTLDTLKYLGINGCDSTVFLEIRIIRSWNIVDSIPLCYGKSVQIGKWTVWSPGIVRDSTISTSGCDSIYTGYVYYKNTDTFELKRCSTDTLFFANDTITKTGVYSYIIKQSNGCDSVYQIAVNSFPWINRSISVSLDTFYADKKFNQFQWYRNGLLISGATGSEFLALKSGFYKYSALDSNGCVDTSNVVWHTPVGLAQLKDRIELYPNPAQDYVVIRGVEGIKMVILYNSLGQIALNQEVLGDRNLILRTENLNPGAYWISLISEENETLRKTLILE